MSEASNSQAQSKSEHYRQKFYLVINSIPQGKVLTYGQVAQMAGYPRMARAVGRALKELPKGSQLPWFRVINAKGELSFALQSASYQRQRQALEAEGVVFIGHKISLKDYRWNGD